MADEVNPLSQAANTDTNAKAADGAKDVSGTVAAQPTKEDWTDSRKEQRAIRDSLAELINLLKPGQAKAAETPVKKESVKTDDPNAELMARLAKLEADHANTLRDSAVKDALLAHGVTNADAQALIRTAATSVKVEEVSALVEKYAALFKTTGDRPSGIKSGTSNTGAAGADNKAIIPSDIYAMGAAFKDLSPEERKKRWNDHLASSGGGNPAVMARQLKNKAK